MRDVHRLSSISQAPRDLEMAARIGRRYEGGACRLKMAHFPLQQGVGLVRLRQRVHTGAAATPRRLGELDERHAWEEPKQRSRLGGHLLPVHEVT